jgi:hypothetical protein
MFRRLSLATFALAALVSAQAETVLAAARAVRSVESASVVAVQPAGSADLVLLGRGFDAGLRQGMICRVTRGALEIGEVQLVGLRDRAAAALILSLSPGQSIRSGDVATVKVQSS